MTLSSHRVVQIVFNLNIERVGGGGATRLAIEIANGLRGSSVQPAVWALWDFGTNEEKSRKASLEAIGIETFMGASWDGQQPYKALWNAYEAFARQLRVTPVTIVHSHSEFGDIVALLLKFTNPKLKIVRTVHGGHYREWHHRPFRRLLLTNLLFPLLYDLEAGVGPHVVAELDRRYLARWLHKQAHYFPSGLRLTRFGNLEADISMKKQELSIPRGSFVVGAVGRIVEQKGYGYLVDAAKIVTQKLPNVYFLIIGDGPLIDNLRQQAKLAGLDKQVVLIGGRSDVEQLYRCMDLFVSSSLWEGLPVVIMESMASGTPVVATAIPGHIDLIAHGETGWLVPPQDPVAIAEAILELYNNPNLCLRMAKTALKHVNAFSIDAVIQQNRRAYVELANP